MQAKLAQNRAYRGQRQTEFNVREVLSRGVPNGTTLQQVRDMVAAGNVSTLPTQYSSGSHVYYTFAEVTVDPQTGMANGLAHLHQTNDMRLTANER